ncbi:serine hydrolase [Rubellicoccus peritrichatus]|uniref:Serine hydrolase n=1 Tax=Rubellicoccus peritrichatus TaxID=3080537 RepID=A0AAQ3LCB3_9BACT|nr:serine hydrolase [Puniceicoccus sp. CR14]WOO40918.1 serine hydrolase [Puniceicoccus sp. CR14]
MLRQLLTLRNVNTLLATAFAPLIGLAQDESLDDKVNNALPLIDALAENTLTQTGIPGIAMAVVYKDEVVLIKGYGVKEAETADAIDLNTVFQIASLSKPMATTVGAAIVGKGMADWDDPVVKYDPGFRLSNDFLSSDVTIADFFSHRSGLPAQSGDKLEDMGFNRHDVLVQQRFLAPAYAFRDGYRYTNFGFTQAGVAIARAAGMTWEATAEQYIFDPLGMGSTSYRYQDYLDAENKSLIHVQVSPGVWEALYTRDPDAQAPAGSLSTTISDYTKWMRLQLAEGEFNGERLLDLDALIETWRPHAQTGFNPDTRQASYYALGWNVQNNTDGGLMISHSGAFDLGVRTGVRLYPDIDLGIAVFVNGGVNGIPEGLQFSFADYVFRGELTRDWVAFANEQFEQISAESYGYGGDYSTPPENPISAKANRAYTGTFTSEYWGDVTVYEANGNLVFDIGPLPQTFELTHWDGDEFLFQPIGESAGPVSKFTFQFAEVGDEVASDILIEYYDVERDGSFVRKESWLDYTGWVRIFELAYAYVVPDLLEGSGPSAWFWAERDNWSEWLWATEDFYPWMYSTIDESWTYVGGISVDRSGPDNDFVSWWIYFANTGSWESFQDTYAKENNYGLSKAAEIEYLATPYGYEDEWQRYFLEAIDYVARIE